MSKLKQKSVYNNWEEVDSAFQELGELKIKKQKLEGEQTMKINDIKEEIAAKSGNIVEKINQIEKQITRFAEEHKEEFAKKRSKKLTFGTISFKHSKKIYCSCVDAAIKCLKALNLTYCIRIKEELDKEQLIEVDEQILTKAGIQLKRKDNISIEPNFEYLAAIQN